MTSKEYRTITLREHDYLYREDSDELIGGEIDEKFVLPYEEFNELRKHIYKLEDRYSNVSDSDEDANKYKASFRVLDKKMKALNYVGAILTGKGTNIEILPKIDLGISDDQDSANINTRQIFMQMLKNYLTGKNKNHRQFDSGVWGNPELPLLEVFMSVFLQEVSTLVRRGLARAYIPHEENLTCLKGKLDFTNHIKHNLFHKERFYVNYDEFSVDRPINRVIKKALEQVSKEARHPDNYGRAKQLLHYFDEVSNPRDWRHDVKVTKKDRSVNYKSYEESFMWAKLILDNFSPDNWEGEKKTISLLFPMEKIFEEYILYILEKSFRTLAPCWKLSYQSPQHRIMSEERGNVSFAIRPDLLAKHKTAPYCIILDTKWKRINGRGAGDKYGINQSDIYQLYSYGKVYQRKDKNAVDTSLVLLYPQNDNFREPVDFNEDENQSVHNKNSLDRSESLNLKIFPIDLSGLAETDSKKLEDAERKIARGIIDECIPEQRATKEEAS